MQPLYISEKDCSIIRTNLGERVAKIVVQAIYTVMDVANDFPSSHVTRGLIPAAEKLIEVAKEPEMLDSYKNAFSPSTRIFMCLSEAESLLRSTRQRVAGLPATREFSRLPFELPPPCVHLFYQTCEYVVSEILNIFNKKYFKIYIPYLTVDTVDGPKHSFLSIRMPEHRLFDTSVYSAISHETFHAFVSNNNAKIFKSKKVVDFVKEGQLASQKTQEFERVALVEEFTVEILDFEFSYLGLFEKYIDDECNFFGSYLKDSIKGNLSLKDIIQYVFRTFIVRVWFLTKTDSVYHAIPKPTNIAEIPSHLRKLLRQHIEDFKKILSSYHEGVENLLLDNMVVGLQHDFEELSPSLNVIFAYVSAILKQEKAQLNKLRDYFENSKINKIAESIGKGIVCNEQIEYPHLLVLEVARIFRSEYAMNKKSKATTVALILSLWNSKNISEYKMKRSKILSRNYRGLLSDN